jgi:Lon protease-like protein
MLARLRATGGLAVLLLHSSVHGFSARPFLGTGCLRAPAVAARRPPLRFSERPGLGCRPRAPGAALAMELADADPSRLFETVSAMEPTFLAPVTKNSEATENATVLPLFPLGSAVYTPFSEHRLNIFEPRYRAMYNDILFSGSRRFAVCTMHPEDGRFSQYATVFYLKDLKEVSEQTNDAVKFVCDHEVIGRVKINKILNPSAWEKADTYLKIEVDYQEDEDEDEEQIAQVESSLKKEYSALVDLQHELAEGVKFTKDSVGQFNTTQGKGFWTTIEMWQVFQQQRLLAKQQEMQREFQTKLINYLTKEGGSGKLPEVVNIAELPGDLQQEVRALQTRMSDDLEPMQVVLFLRVG